jgi:hypothetical protein
MNDWQNEFFGLTNLTGMHDEEDEQDEGGQRWEGPPRELSQRRGSVKRSDGSKPGRNPCLEILRFAQHEIRNFYEFIVLQADYTQVHIADIRNFDVSSLRKDVIGLAIRKSPGWDAYYLSPSNDKPCLRKGYSTGKQAVDHITAIHKNGRQRKSF